MMQSRDDFEIGPEQLHHVYGLSDGGLDLQDFVRKGEAVIRVGTSPPGIQKLRMLGILPTVETIDSVKQPRKENR